MKRVFTLKSRIWNLSVFNSKRCCVKMIGYKCAHLTFFTVINTFCDRGCFCYTRKVWLNIGFQTITKSILLCTCKYNVVILSVHIRTNFTIVTWYNSNKKIKQNYVIVSSHQCINYDNFFYCYTSVRTYIEYQ